MGRDERDGERVFTFVCSEVMFVCFRVCVCAYLCV